MSISQLDAEALRQSLEQLARCHGIRQWDLGASCSDATPRCRSIAAKPSR
jgi:hypothetical protein